jgi:hypothetical protein
MLAMMPNSEDYDLVDRTALGVLRFVDAATGQSVTGGLSVVARVRETAVAASLSSRGVFVFHCLPGMQAASFWNAEEISKPVAHEFIIEVRDALRRFFPMSFKVSFPAWPEAAAICPDHPLLDKKIPLYSTPWRETRLDFAVIRGTLLSLTRKMPAAWAFLSVFRATDEPETDAPLVSGVSDERGEFMLMFPWPKAEVSNFGDSSVLHWNFRILAFYDLPKPDDSAEDLPDGVHRLPSLCPILKQVPATLLAEIGPLQQPPLDPPHVLPLQEMRANETRLLRTSGEKVLYINE